MEERALGHITPTYGHDKCYIFQDCKKNHRNSSWCQYPFLISTVRRIQGDAQSESVIWLPVWSYRILDFKNWQHGILGKLFKLLVSYKDLFPDTSLLTRTFLLCTCQLFFSLYSSPSSTLKYICWVSWHHSTITTALAKIPQLDFSRLFSSLPPLFPSF